MRKIASDIGQQVGAIHGYRGKAYINKKISGFNKVAEHGPWLVVRDLDQDSDCPVKLRNTLLPSPSMYMCFRIAVREIETWLLADRHAFSSYLSIPIGQIPADPESLEDPKAALISLVQCCRNRRIKEDMIPRAGSGRTIGSGYTSRVSEYLSNHWNANVAAQNSESLQKTINCWQTMIEEYLAAHS